MMSIKIDYAYIQGARYGAIRADEGAWEPYIIEPLHKQIGRALWNLCRWFITFD
jgi:hypothetical protein